MKTGRNEPCKCGSGKKYKNCCATKPAPRSQWLAILAVAVFAVAAAWGVGRAFLDSGEEQEAPPGMVWSEEHGHWHELPGYKANAIPPGPAPEGAVWSAEHGHWHDAETGQPIPGDSTSQP